MNIHVIAGVLSSTLQNFSICSEGSGAFDLRHWFPKLASTPDSVASGDFYRKSSHFYEKACSRCCEPCYQKYLVTSFCRGVYKTGQSAPQFSSALLRKTAAKSAYYLQLWLFPTSSLSPSTPAPTLTVCSTRPLQLAPTAVVSKSRHKMDMIVRQPPGSFAPSKCSFLIHSNGTNELS
jgi:hypothetical protein